MTDDDDVAIPIDPDLSPADPGVPAIDRRTVRAPRRHRRIEPDVLAVIAVGGMLGAAARFRLAEAIPTPHDRFPWATFCTNVSGSFVLGLLLVLLLERFRPTRYLRPFVATGILGAFTTMSTFTVETALLLKDGHAMTAMAYALGSFAAGIALAYAGIVVARIGAQRHRNEALPG
ncbi:MAG TPA: CrcB family protein [Ilumatobacteraceae bacterium]